MFDAVLIANRGEIARRVIRTLRRLGIRAVAVYAPDDSDAIHVGEADEAVAISSYMSIDDLLDACRETGAQALHPGYGFLSERPQLALACAAAGVAFVGPPAPASELMGDKVRAKRAAHDAGLPTLASFTERQAREPGAPYPLLVKAAAGGGGRGMRIVGRPEDLDAALESARREARTGFGDDRLFIEPFLQRARHLEVQVIADEHGSVLHLGERECSLQRRHQKLIEESPSPAVSPALRERLGTEAVALMRAAGYVNAGTVEFIADAQDPERHWFLECNARLQVEHPVTELVTGLDLVELQLRVAAGERLPLRQEDVRIEGHAIEARINAEDAARGFLPATGRVIAYDPPDASEGIRVDDAIRQGSEIGSGYDSLLAKVIAAGPDRATALARLDRALAGTTVLGVRTTAGFLRSVLATQDVRDGRLDTGMIERLDAYRPPRSDEEVARAAAILSIAGRRAPADDPIERVDGWRLGGRRAGSWWRLAIGGGQPVDVELPPFQPGTTVQRIAAGRSRIADAGRERVWSHARDGDTLWLGCDGDAWQVRRATAAQAGSAQADGDLRAPMPGQVLLVHGAVGDPVSAGDPLVVLESMKMELVLSAPVDGTLAAVAVSAGDRVVLDQPLVRVEVVP
jgi:acetyl-CoA/propionyl-CoA carboxylase biotin carboxyl carrier protein